MRYVLAAVWFAVGLLAVAVLYSASILRSLLRVMYGEPEPEGLMSKINPAKLRKYAKAVVAVAGVVATVANVVANGGSATQIVIALVTAVGVHQVKNVDKA